MIDTRLLYLSTLIYKEWMEKRFNHPISTLIYIPSDMFWNYGLYELLEKRIELCDIFKQQGFSCRIGTAHYWENNVSAQSGIIELSKKVVFNFPNAEDYNKELIQGEN